jgi:hypothetical protein
MDLPAELKEKLDFDHGKSFSFLDVWFIIPILFQMVPSSS